MATAPPPPPSKTAPAPPNCNGDSMEPMELKLHATIRFLQLQNGLRHGDYQRYRHYTTRRLRRLRVRAKATHQGKGKTFASRPVTLEGMGGAEKLRADHLLIALLNAERAWAFAQQVKQQDDQPLSSHRKSHLVRRLKRAATWASTLQDLVTHATPSGRISERTLLEVEAYAGWMESLQLMETEKWSQALQKLGPAHTILSHLGEVGTLEEQDLFSNRAEEVLQSVRFCQYNLGEGSTQDTEDLLNKMKATRGDLVPQAVRDKLEVVLVSSRKEQADHMEQVTWRHRSISLPTENIRMAMLKVDEAVKQLSDAAPDDKDVLYTQVYSAYDEALGEVGKEEAVVANMSSGAKVEAQQRDLRLLRTYLMHSKLSRMSERNQALVARLVDGHNRPEDIVHVYTALQQNANDMLKLPGMDDLDDIQAEAQALETLYRAYRAFHLAEYYASPAASKLPQALLLYEHAGRLAEDAETPMEGLEGMDAQHKDVRELKALASGGRHRALALSVVRQTSSGPTPTDQLVKALSALTLADKPAAGSSTRAGKKGGSGSITLLNRLDTLDAGSEADGFSIASLPPELQPMRAKPPLFDMAYNSFERRTPDLTAKAGVQSVQERKGSGGIFGWFRG